MKRAECGIDTVYALNNTGRMNVQTYASTPVVCKFNRVISSVFCCLLVFPPLTLGKHTSNSEENGKSLNALYNSSVILHAVTSPLGEECIYTKWSEWFGYCPPRNSCGSGIVTRNRIPAGNVDGCTDNIQERRCEDECVHVLTVIGILVIGVIDNPALGAGEDPTSPLSPENVRYTYGSLFDCSEGCQDIEVLTRNHDTVCLMCTNVNSCKRAGSLHLNKISKLDFLRTTRKGAYTVKRDGESCSCSFKPEFSLVTGVCSAPSYYINLTVL